MGRSGRNKEKQGKSGNLSLDNSNEGTAARTRPLSFDEIMIIRKNKNLPENVKEEVTDVGNISGDGTTANVSDYYDSGRHHRCKKDSSPGVHMHVAEEFVKARSWKKEDSAFTKDSALTSRWKERENQELKTKIKDESLAKPKPREILKSEIRLKDGSLVTEKDRGSRGSETKLKAEIVKEISSKAKGKADKVVPGRGKIYGRSIDDSNDEPIKKHSRNLSWKDRHADKSGDKSERESKRKHRNGDDEKKRDKSAAKKVDLGKGHGLEASDRKESPKSQYGESRLKRRRSRSREREDRNRRSISLSPSAHKRTSYYGHEHEELSSHSSRDRSGRKHSDIDWSKVTSNGSGGHYRRHGGFSGLGGYSPRKRRTEAAIRTPSPINRSPEKKSAKWDVAPMETSSVPSNAQVSNQTASSSAHEVVSSIPVTSKTANPLSGILATASLAKLNVTIDSVQLTQATRPMRRLYVENIPASASEKAVMEFLNNLLLSSSVNCIRGSLPCISCVIQREKGQALVEFLTAEDASAALSCDGCSLSGSILKFRRPKDFVEVASGEAEKSVASVNSISHIVKDSPHKIFIGGISKTLSSKMVMEIASAFGPLKAYHFEDNENREGPCAFLEYGDQSLTLKACAILNGMKVGGQVLTAVQAIPDGSKLENNENPPFYGIPERALPLLKKPTQVLKLKNVFNPEGFSSLSDLEVEEVLEDIKLECARFGTVKSINVVKYGDSLVATTEASEANENTTSAGIGQHLTGSKTNEKGGSLEEVTDNTSEGNNGLVFPSEAKEVEAVDEGNSINDNKSVGDTMEDEQCQLGNNISNMAVEDLARDSASETFSQEIPKQSNALKDDSCSHDDKVACGIQKDDMSVEKRLSAEQLNPEEVNRNSPDIVAGRDGGVEMQSNSPVENGKNEKQDHNLRHIFEAGCVYVEYRRTEASCTAAHCVHGRLFDDRVVTVEYVPHDLYRARFSK